MNGHAKDTPINRLDGWLAKRGARSVRTIRSARFAELDALRAAAGDEGAFQGPVALVHELDCMPWLEGAEYQYRLGTHELVLAIRGVTALHEKAVSRDEAEFALVVEGPLLVFGCRFGDVMPWTWAAPYNWHFTYPPERVVPAAVALTPETYARLWATLWITLVEIGDRRVRVRRAVTLRPEFAHALHGVLREQALRPFLGAAANVALDRLRHASDPLSLRARVRTTCAAMSDYGSR